MTVHPNLLTKIEYECSSVVLNVHPIRGVYAELNVFKIQCKFKNYVMTGLMNFKIM